MRILKMCKNCRSLDWIKIKDNEHCQACNTSDCCAHRIWMPVEDVEIEEVEMDGKLIRFYGGYLEDLGDD